MKYTTSRRILLSLSAALGLLSTQAHALDQVTVALAIPPAVHDGAPYAAGDELGFFKEEGLEVKVLVFQGAGALIPQVASKRVTFGYPTSEPIISAYLNGKDHLPLKYFYNGVPANTMEFAVLANSPIKTITDLKGKKIGVGALTWGTIPGGRAALSIAGIKQGDYQYVPVGALGAGFQALRSGAVDALNFNSSWDDQLEMTGTQIRRIAYPAVFAESAGNGFIAHVDTFRDHPDLIERFGRAYTKAQIACDTNPTFCVQAFWREHPEAKPQGGDPAKQLAESATLLRNRLDRVLREPNGTTRKPGYYDLSAIHLGIVAMAKSGEYKSADVPLDQIFSNQFVPKFSDFDHAAVIAKAKEAK